MSISDALNLVLVPTGLVIGHLAIAARIFRGGPTIEMGVRLLASGWAAALFLGWGLRAAAVARLPMVGLSESNLSMAVTTVVVSIIWEIHHKGRTIITPLSVLIAAALLSHGNRFAPALSEVVFTQGSLAITVHTIFAWTAFGLFALANFLALRLVLGHTEGDDLGPELRIALRLALVVFSMTLITGFLTSPAIFGVPTHLDPIEALGLLIWSATGVLLISEHRGKWPSKRLARWTLALFALVVVTSQCLPYLPEGTTYHVFEPLSSQD